jgi:hypothetical protein
MDGDTEGSYAGSNTTVHLGTRPSYIQKNSIIWKKFKKI